MGIKKYDDGEFKIFLQKESFGTVYWRVYHYKRFCAVVCESPSWNFWQLNESGKATSGIFCSLVRNLRINKLLIK